MDFTGQYRIPAPPGRVWQALNDEHVLRVCIPGCQELEKTAADSFRARVATKIGAIKASFAGRVTLSDLDPPNGYTISGQGEGGPAGFARGSARVELAPDGPGATVLTYRAKAEVGGKLASVGSRLVQGVATKTADDFFTRFSAAVSDGGDMARPIPKPHTTEQPVRGPSGSPPERHGPAERLVGDIHQVPPVPTIPYTLGQTPKQQNRTLVIGVTLWVFITALIFLSG